MEKNKELTFAMIKPDAVEDKNSGEIISYLEKRGFEILGINKRQISKETAEEFYDEHKNKPFFNEMTRFISRSPVIIMCLRRENAVNELRKIIGDTNPDKAIKGTLRRLYGTNIQCNAIHASDSHESAQREILLFFKNEKILS